MIRRLFKLSPAMLAILTLATGLPAHSQDSPGTLDHSFDANARLSISPPTGPFALAQPFDLQINVGGWQTQRIFSGVDEDTGGGAGNQYDGRPVSGPALITQDDGPVKTIRIVPVQLGEVTVQVVVQYTDGGFAMKEAKVNVTGSGPGLSRLQLANFAVMPLVADGGKTSSQQYLMPVVFYSHLKYPIYLNDSKQIQLTVQQPEDNPIVKVDPDGLIHALQPGTAVVVGSFGGLQNRVTVHVYSRENEPEYMRSLDPPN